ncbi:MAG: hypothetical protein HDT44_09100 [Ruminococcaceae bacterium]|nr:hypothetical protein [Oscillospiraceae bacterium]
MKKKLVLLVGILFSIFCLFATACSNEFAAQEYNNDQKISQGDRFAASVSVYNQINGGYSFTASKYDGRDTLWTKTLQSDTNRDLQISLSLSSGQAKIVHIDSEGNVTTLVECTPDTSIDGSVTVNLSLKSGQNKLKIVGYDCEDVDLKLLFEEP